MNRIDELTKTYNTTVYMDSMLIPRLLEPKLHKSLQERSKILILYGPRQAGKTTLINQLLAHNASMKTLLLTGDDPADRYELEGRDIIALKRLIEGYDCLVIDEAQRIAAIGLTLKLLHDSQVNLKIIATGSSSIKPALTRFRGSWLGRQIRLTIFYLS